MYTIPFLASPVHFAIKAYHNHTIKQPIYFYPSEVPKDSTDELKLKTSRIEILQESLKVFFEKYNIRKDLILLEAFSSYKVKSQGANSSSKGDAVITLPVGLYEASKDACIWALKHEISHIKNNDHVNTPLFACISSLAAAALGTIFLPFASTMILTVIVGCVAHVAFTRYRAYKADTFANDTSSSEELAGGRKLLNALRSLNVTNRTTVLSKILYTQTGESRFDFSEPSFESRIKKIEAELFKRGMKVDPFASIEYNILVAFIEKRSGSEAAIVRNARWRSAMG